MAQPLPQWQTRFLEQHRLQPAYLDSAQKWFAPIAKLVAGHQKEVRRPWLVAVNGSQGSGKSTFCDYLAIFLREQHGLNCVALSLDDFYLTRQQRSVLANDVHPLLATRGVPGTHDMGLLMAVLDQLLAGQPATVPRFDKSTDDRSSKEAWDRVDEPVDIVFLEGWCLGAAAQTEAELLEPVNAFEQTEDPDGQWRRYVNRILETDFPPLYARVNEWIMLRAPSFDCVYRWRLEQEQKLVASASGGEIMSDVQIERFVQFYQRLTSHCLKHLPRQVNHLLALSEERAVTSYLAAPGDRL